jgi:hypothetical protein
MHEKNPKGKIMAEKSDNRRSGLKQTKKFKR